MNSEDISEAYDRFIKINSEVENKIVPIIPKKKIYMPIHRYTGHTS